MRRPLPAPAPRLTAPASLLLALGLAACGASAPPRSDAPAVMPGYASFAHHGTHPVVDTSEEAGVEVGLSADHASYALVRHYLDANRLPPAEAVRVEDCLAALAPAATGFEVRMTLAPSPFRPGWHALVLSVAAPARGAPHRPTVLSATPDAPLERALAARGLPVLRGGVEALIDTLGAHPQVVLVTSAAGLGGVDAQAPLLDAVVAQRAAGRLLSVVERVEPGLDDALLDALAAAGGGLHEVVAPAPPTLATEALATRLTAPLGFVGLRAAVRFDAAHVLRWRLVGHESRAARTSGLASAPRGGLVPAGEVIDLLFEVKLAPTAAHQRLGTLTLSGDGPARVRPIEPGAAGPRHEAVVAIAAFAEKLRGSYWLKDLAWDGLERAAAALAFPELARELGALIARTRALWHADAALQRPLLVTRGLP